MQYRTLGRTGIAVSTIVLGTMDFGSLTPEEDAHAVLDAFLDAGGNLVDTSNVYNGGLVEEIIGRWFASRPGEVTDRVVLATRGRFSPDTDVNAIGSRAAGLRRSLDGSLRRLGRDHVDLYQIHAWDPITPVEETLTFLDDAVRSGKVNYIGLSNFTGWQLQLMMSTAHALRLQLPVTIQQQYSLLSRESEWEVVPAAMHNNVGILPWSPLAGGFLAGKYERGAAPGNNTRAGVRQPALPVGLGGVRQVGPQLVDDQRRRAHSPGDRRDPSAGRPALASGPAGRNCSDRRSAGASSSSRKTSAPSIWNSTKTPSLRSAG